MFLALVIIGVLVSVIVHELGHAVVMHKKGIPLQEVGVGLPFFFMLKVRMKKNWPPVRLSPLLLGAYVKPTEEGAEKLESLPYNDQVEIFGAGVLAGIFFAAPFFLIAYILYGIQGDSWNLRLWFFIGGNIFGTAALWKFRQLFLRYGIPLAGVALAAYILAETLRSTGAGGVGGPISIVRQAAQTSSLYDVLVLIGAVSFGISLVNMLPLIPFDGGRCAYAFFEKKMGTQKIAATFRVGSLAVALVFIGAVIINDVLSIF